MIYYLGASILGMWLLWVFFLAVMNLSRAKKAGTLSKTALILGIPVLLIGYALDVLVNIFVMSVIMLEPPFEMTVTERLQRHHRESTGWRLKVVEWFESILDQFDPDGDHV